MKKSKGQKKDNRITEWRDRTVKSQGMTGWKNGKFMDNTKHNKKRKM